MFTTSFELTIYIIITEDGGKWVLQKWATVGPISQVQNCRLTGRQIQGEQGSGWGRKRSRLPIPTGTSASC